MVGRDPTDIRDTKALPGQRLRAIRGVAVVLQMKKIVRLPVWLSFQDGKNGVKVIHEITVGFGGIGGILDVILGMLLSRDFARAMDEHVKTEFPKLALY